MSSPIVAMLWENWRLSRVEAAQRFGLGMVVASAVIVLADTGAAAAFTLLAAIHAFFWFSIAKLNGGRFMDGYKPGFPLYLLFARPIRTPVIVGVAMAYDAVSCVALYILSAALIGLAFHQPMPMFSVALLLVTIHCVLTCIQWSTRNRSVQWSGSLAVSMPFFLLFTKHLTLPLDIEFSLAGNTLMVFVCFVSYGLTVAGVARQRRGDSDEKAPPSGTWGGYPVWIVNFFHFPCPTSSAMRAQIWFELKSSGLPVLMIGLAAAVLIFLLFAIGIPIEHARHIAIAVSVLSVVVVLFQLGGNAFGIRRRQGRAYVSAFESTQPFGISRLVGVKVAVRTACMLIALLVIGVSVWASSSLMSAWGEWMVNGNNVSANLLKQRSEWGAEFLFGLTGREYAVRAVVALIGLALLVVSLATFAALRARYPRRVFVAVLLALLCGFTFVVLAWTVRHGVAPASLLHAFVAATKWLAAAAIVLIPIYLIWSGLAERALTAGYLCGAVAISAAFGLAFMPANGIVPALAAWMLPLMLCVAGPWSFSRIRRM
jgi:hypothetical protein